MPRVYILYHKDCQDGAGARTAAHLKFGSSATYIPVQYREPLPVLEDGSDVYILDFSYSREILEDLNMRMAKLVVLDHHKTAAQDLKGLDYAIFDMKRSGAMMAWEYFHPGVRIPEIIHLVQDRDLWQFKFPLTNETYAGMQLRRDDFDDWKLAVRGDEESAYFLDKVRQEGKVIMKYEKELIRAALQEARIVPFLTTRVTIVNSSVLRHEIGDAITTDKTGRFGTPGAIIYTIHPDLKQATLSFRGAENTDWSWVARALGGGGGHARACNAIVNLDVLERILNGKFRHLPGESSVYRFRRWVVSLLERLELALQG